jgi:predicted Zn-dependent protease
LEILNKTGYDSTGFEDFFEKIETRWMNEHQVFRRLLVRAKSRRHS